MSEFCEIRDGDGKLRRCVALRPDELRELNAAFADDPTREGWQARPRKRAADSRHEGLAG
jgi:hypothetical protein